MQSAAKRDKIIRLGAWLILVLALMPSISYMGHWPEMAGTAHAHGAADFEAAHATHCHVGHAHCGGGESMIRTPFVGDDKDGLVLPGHESKIDTVRLLAALAGHATPILQPPRPA